MYRNLRHAPADGKRRRDRSGGFRLVGCRHHHSRTGRRNPHPAGRRQCGRSWPIGRSLCARNLRSPLPKKSEGTYHENRATAPTPHRLHPLENPARFDRAHRQPPRRAESRLLPLHATARHTGTPDIQERKERSALRRHLHEGVAQPHPAGYALGNRSTLPIRQIPRRRLAGFFDRHASAGGLRRKQADFRRSLLLARQHDSVLSIPPHFKRRSTSAKPPPGTRPAKTSLS